MEVHSNYKHINKESKGASGVKYFLIDFYRETRLCEVRKYIMSIPVIEIPWDAKGTFRSRPNRFLGIVDIKSPKKEKKSKVKAHVHDPGRLKELLFPGNQVLLKKASNKNRKTKWDIIAASHDDKWVLVHSGYHRKIAEWVIDHENVSPFGRIEDIKPEAKFGESRLDFLLIRRNGQKVWVEVKGCTLAVDSVALFPDAPTKRGTRHIRHLIEAKEKGEEAAILMLVFRSDTKCFAPNKEMDFEFWQAFIRAYEIGVEVHALLFQYKNKVVNYIGKIPVCDEI